MVIAINRSINPCKIVGTLLPKKEGVAGDIATRHRVQTKPRLKDLKLRLRPNLKRKFFNAVNRVPIHCDADFRPLTPEKVVRLLVQTLAKRDQGRFEEYTPLFANLHSHESQPIQIADLMAGAIKTVIENEKSKELLHLLPFDLRKMKRYSDNPPKAYYWFAKADKTESSGAVCL